MKKGHILIAEDDPVLRGVYEKKFAVSGYDITTAEDGEEVIKEIEKEAPDLLLLDINMPVIDGFGVLAKYPKKERRFLIVLLTNFHDEKNKERGKELGADGYFVKSEMNLKALLEFTDRVMDLERFREK